MEAKFKNFTLVNNALVKRDITVIRNKKTEPEQFRLSVGRIATVLASSVSKEFKLQSFDVETPLEKTTGYKIAHPIILVPVLRAGLALVSGFLELIPEASVGHIGLQRDEETLKPIEYYYKTPKHLQEALTILLDPMLATGGSASEALKYLKQKGAGNMVFVCLVAAPEGIKKVEKDHPDIKIFGVALDRELNSKGFILPGLGDAGDRTFGTL